MTEREKINPELVAFKEGFRVGLNETIELTAQFGEPLVVDPFSMGIMERTYDELTDEERAAAEQIIFAELGVSPDDLEEKKVREYVTTVPEEIKIAVYRTARKEVFLQRLVYEDGAKHWAVGPDQNL